MSAVIGWTAPPIIYAAATLLLFFVARANQFMRRCRALHDRCYYPSI